MIDKDSLNNEISVGVTFASLMAAISLFFTGALITAYQSFGPTIKVPLLYLIVSTFSFIFAATIYSNAGSEVTLGKLKTVEKYMIYAKNIVEFLGLYPLILATPLVIGAITEDGFLRGSTTIIAVLGMALYSQSKFSILDKQLSGHQKLFYSMLIVSLAISLYLSQSLKQLDTVSFYSFVSVVLLLSLLFPTVYFSMRSQQYRVIFIRPFRDKDAIGLSRLLQNNLTKSKLSKQPSEVIDGLHAIASESAISKLAAEQSILVAVSSNRCVGFVCFADNKIVNIFTDPKLHRKGIGRMLVDSAEVAVSEQGHEEIEAYAYASYHKFFQKLGYQYVDKDGANKIILRKEM